MGAPPGRDIVWNEGRRAVVAMVTTVRLLSRLLRQRQKTKRWSYVINLVKYERNRTSFFKYGLHEFCEYLLP